MYMWEYFCENKKIVKRKFNNFIKEDLEVDYEFRNEHTICGNPKIKKK